MNQVVLWLAAASLALGTFWLGTETHRPLVRVLLRPAVLGLLGMLVLVLALGEPVRWPYALVAASALLGVGESYAGAYQMLDAPRVRRTHAEQVQICGAWLILALFNLMLLNLACYVAFPNTFEFRGGAASLLDVIYLTLLTFASAGFGDVLPATTLGKLLVMLTSLAGLIYATILFAALFHVLRED